MKSEHLAELPERCNWKALLIEVTDGYIFSMQGQQNDGIFDMVLKARWEF